MKSKLLIKGIDCHKIKTKEDMIAIAKYRRIEKQQNKNHVLL